MHPDDREHVLGEWQRCAESGIVFDLQFRVLRRSGKLSYVRSLSRPVLGRDGTVTSHVGSVEDRSELRVKQHALKKSEQLLKETGAMAQVGGWELDLVTDDLQWSEQTFLIHGVSPDHQPTLQEAFDFYSAESRPVIHAIVTRAIEFGESWDVELVLKKACGRCIWVCAVGRAEFEGGRVVRLVGTFQNVDREVRQRRELAEQRELLQVTLQSIGDAVITTDASGGISWMNPVAEQLTGWMVDEAMGTPLSHVYRTLHEQTRELADCPAKACLADGLLMCSGDCTILVSRSGDEFGIQESAAPIKSAEGRTLGAVLVFHDVTEQRRLSSDMTYRATHDSLTGLFNRAEFEACLRRTLERTNRDQSRHALLYIDLDQFKLVNDTCGHSVGDEFLQQIARLLRKAVRADDLLARLGGDEFGIILVDCSPGLAKQMARRICKQLDEFRFVSDGKRFRVGTSIGLVPLDDRWQNSDLALQAADSSCYAAKEAGRNRVHVWFDSDKEMRVREDDMHWASRLAQAIDENRFVLYAQRIESLSHLSCGVHAEVLIRLQTQSGELIQPGAFLPAAERFHLASRMDRWVLQKAINVMVNLPDVSLVERLCINLSGQSVGDRVFHQDAIDMLSAAGPAICERICLEITETAAVTNITDASDFIDQLHDLGVLIALDDFGAGSSSFGYLKSLKVDVLKIDGQFIEGLISDSLDEAAVRCFVDVAGVLNIKTVAEFVDLPELHERVKEVGIDYAQGFIVHQPEPIENVLEFSDEMSFDRRQALICGAA